ncbi:Vegetative incompatibility protein HET-E-1 [Colletotrichum tropicale]|nr:Vegetative incompatibility protein HET-E-1 [Colletotrichum tropicale]
MSIRLIDVETLRLKSFNTRKTPPYAILSHTWVEDEEVSFEEMRQIAENPNHPARRKSGYRKIRETCRQVRVLRLGYAWVDTCCIDKSSSAELSEAINSMFRWYRDAHVCIAYLSDYSSLGTKKDDMKECKWFTRGWCLQELIAPKVLIFYDQNWKAFGSRHDDQRLVASITGIDQSVLVNHNQMYSLPVAQRMSWASRRTTTRVEDTAYCLLGIFDIHMPLLYGEGEKAFLRLQEEIIRRLNDTSVFLFSPKALGQNSFSSSESIHSNTDVNLTDGPSENAAVGSSEPEERNPYLKDLSEQQFCGMFATSPADFHGCGDMMRRGDHRAPFDRHAFSVTNRGIQLGKQVLWYGFGEKNYFVWETPFRHHNHKDFPLHGTITLRKIGHNLFARVLFPKVRMSNARRNIVHEDVCVLRHMTPSTERQIHQSLKTVLRINC